MEGLRQQAVAMNSAVEEAKDAVARDQSLRILGRRRAELDEAYDSYQLAFQCYRRVADRGSCSFSTALAARHLILGFWGKAMDELEARMEVMEEENVAAEQEEDKEVEEPRIDKVEVVMTASKVELECGAAKDDVVLGGGALDPGEGDQSDANDELVCRAAKDDFLQGGGAIDPGEGDCEIGAKVKVEVTCVGKEVAEIRVAQVKVGRIDVYKVRAEEYANLEVLRDGARDPGDGDRQIGAKEVEEPRIDKVEVKLAANRIEVLLSGGLDPGEVAGEDMEVKQVDDDVNQDLGGMLCGKFEVEEPRIDKDGLEYRATKDDPEFRAIKELQELCIPENNHEEEFGAEFEPEIELRRFVTAGCRRALGTNSEYG